MNRSTLLVVAGLLLLAAAPARAGFRSGIKTISAIPVSPAPDTIHVYNDGNRFTHVTQSHVWFRAQTSVECKFNNDLMYSLLAAGSVSTGSGVLGPPQGPWAQVDTNGRQSAFKAPLAELFAAPKLNPAQLCNQEMEKRASAGTASHFEMLQHGFDLLLRYDLTFLANCKFTGKGIGAENDSSGTGSGGGWPITTWDGWGSAGFSTYGTVRCEGGHQGSLTTRPKPPGPASDDLAVPFQITRAALQVAPKKATTRCPATLTANGSISVVGEGTVEYRVEHNGALGPVQQMHFGPGEARSKILSFQLQVGSAPGGEPGKAAAGGGAAAGIGGLAQPEAPKDKARGSLRLVIVSPKAGVDHSNPTGYDITCSSPLPPGPGDVTGAPRRTHGGG